MDAFYESDAWRRIRYQVLLYWGRRCACCGAGEQAELHVDHIKPRSKYPELELWFGNLQVLCKDCNFGKSNIDETDFRNLSRIKHELFVFNLESLGPIIEDLSPEEQMRAVIDWFRPLNVAPP